MLLQPFTMGVDWFEVARLMEVSTMFNNDTYCLFTLYGSTCLMCIWCDLKVYSVIHCLILPFFLKVEIFISVEISGICSIECGYLTDLLAWQNDSWNDKSKHHNSKQNLVSTKWIILSVCCWCPFFKTNSDLQHVWTMSIIDYFQPMRAANSDYTRCSIPKARQNIQSR